MNKLRYMHWQIADIKRRTFPPGKQSGLCMGCGSVFSRIQGADVPLCRTVLIPFGEERRDRVLCL